MLLPWNEKTVIETVVDTISSAGIEKIIVVTGRDAERISEVLSNSKAECVYNPVFQNGNMIDSLKTGLDSLKGEVEAAMMVLGDQPQIESLTVTKLLQEWAIHPNSLCIPSYQMRRGHPWIIPSAIWDDLFFMKLQETMRDFIQQHENVIHYVLVDSPAILADLDSPEDYQNLTV